MNSVLLVAVAALFGTSSVEAFGAASTSNVRSISRSTGEMEMKLFDWKQRQLFENYVVPDGETLNHSVSCLMQHSSFIRTSLIKLNVMKTTHCRHYCITVDRFCAQFQHNRPYPWIKKEVLESRQRYFRRTGQNLRQRYAWSEIKIWWGRRSQTWIWGWTDCSLPSFT